MTHTDRTAVLLEENLADLYEHAPCGYISLLPDGTFAKTNQTFATWLGYDADALRAPMRVQDLLTLPGKMVYVTHYDPLLQLQGFVREVAFDLRCRDGHLLPVFINAVQYRDATNTPVLQRATIFDASERRAYEQELQLARRKAEDALTLRDQFLAVAAHALRTPVTSILGNIHLIQRHVHRDSSLSTRDQRALHIALEQTTRLKTMIESLLDISRMDAGQLAITHAPVDVAMLVYRIVDELQLTQDHHELRVRYLAQSALIAGDELRLEQVVRNLIENACIYSAPRSRVTVVIKQTATQIVVEVRDNGIGIPATDLPHLFARFYRASNVQADAPPGIGIGLYVVKEIVDLHGGDITVASTEGQGSTFTVSFPRVLG